MSSVTDGIYIDVTEKDKSKHVEIDLDSLYNISQISEIMYDEDDEVFYILTNKFDEKLGFFVIRFQVKNPHLYNFLIKWKNKLDIGDTNIHVLRNIN